MDPEGEEVAAAQGIVSDHDADGEVDVDDAREIKKPRESDDENGNENETNSDGTDQQQKQGQNPAHSLPRHDPSQHESHPYPPSAAGPWIPPHPVYPQGPVGLVAGMPPQQQQLPPPPASQDALAMAQYYEARMRDHAAAYASAAAGAAWAAAQIAAQAAEFAANAHGTSFIGTDGAMAPPPPLPMPPPPGPGLFYPPHPDPHAVNNFYHPMAALPNAASGDANDYSHADTNYSNDHTLGNDYCQHPHPNQGFRGTRRTYPEEDDGVEGGWYGYDDSRHSVHDASYPNRNNRRKRYQRRPQPPGGISIPVGANNQNNSNNNSNNNPSRVRRRLRDGGDSSNSSCCSGSLGTSITSYNSDQAMSGNSNFQNSNSTTRASSHYYQNSSSNYYGSSSSGGRGSHYHRIKKKQRQPPDDSSLFGKTAVAALYEYCDKRRMAGPTFVLVDPVDGYLRTGSYEMIAYLEDGEEWGRGRGMTKTSAKHAAARRALQALVPGVAFDENSGVLIELPDRFAAAAAAAKNRNNNDEGKFHAGNNHRKGPNIEASAASLEDLAPHLAERLAIATGDNEEKQSRNAKTKPHPSSASSGGEAEYSSNNFNRNWNIYPGTTSTGTSEEEDENAWYSSRGASVVSALLHALVPIYERILEPPQYSFEVSKVPSANAQMKRKGPASSCGSAIVVHRGTYKCTATLKVLSAMPADRSTDSDNGEPVEESSGAEAGVKLDSSNNDDKSLPEILVENEKGERKKSETEDELKEKVTSETTKHEPSEKAHLDDAKTDDSPLYTVLEVEGEGGTKRESKHIASAKLLALIFPECETMAEVKAAAESMREQYAASKARKLALNKAKRGFTDSNIRRRHGGRGQRSKMPRLNSISSRLYACSTRAESDPPLPNPIVEQLQGIIGAHGSNKSSLICSQVAGFEKLNLNQDSTCETTSDEPSQEQQTTDGDESTSMTVQESICRQVSRQKQLEEQVDRALQTRNEHDEEGRSLTVDDDDVGRTVLRRAEPEDIGRIRKLLSQEASVGSRPGCSKSRTAVAFSALSPVSILGATALVENTGTSSPCDTGLNQDDVALALRLWGSSTFVLLLCRAIAAFEDPPLGCAVLTLGFSMQKGRLLRIAQIGSEPHLPRERFLECLEGFAICMGCVLERNDIIEHNEITRTTTVRFNQDNLKAIVESHLGQWRGTRESERSQAASVSAPLQSVQEESENGDDSDKSAEAVEDKRKGRDKPSKRSRVE